MVDAIGGITMNYALGLSFTTKGLETKFQSLVSIWTMIDFSSNQFSGEIPKMLGELHLLIDLNLSHNCLIGPIPSSLGDLSELESLDLSSNKLEGKIPTELKNLGFLEILNLSQNHLKGPIPQDLCGLPLSKSCDTDEETPAKFDKDGDELNWKISILMGYGSGLVLGMSMAYIVFTTGKPWWLIRIIERVQQRFAERWRSQLFGEFNKLSSLMAMFPGVFLVRALWLLTCSFFEHLDAIREGYGKKVEPKYMVDAIGGITMNYALGLSFTTKGLETKFQSLVSIWTMIDFSSNQFSGEIPKMLGELHLLIDLNLSHNCLIGPIPSSLGDLSELESLDLSSNKLEGKIPTELKNLGFLEILNLSQNHLKGPIPQDLCGLPLSKSCDTDEETPAKFDKDGDELNWKISILMGYGSGLVLGMSMAYIVFTTGKPWWLIRIIERVQQRFAERWRSQLFGEFNKLSSLMAMFPGVFLVRALVGRPASTRWCVDAVHGSNGGTKLLGLGFAENVV
ncbi:receptor-like protein 9DC1 [Gossypium arboreum]|uniref:receptor-like protein 9DC1 n=1 Tax=Gossypium arboreum TaxID=29729 RepID=UPI0022F19BB3|nr:receptor-like protein 9DC1 [Gossypium arboreum]